MSKMPTKFKQGIFKPRNPQKYEGNVHNICYRSSWELKVLNWCDLNSSVIRYSSEEVVIPYIKPTDKRRHRYFVDFKITVKDVTGKLVTYLVEVKPYAQTLPPKAPKRKTRNYLNQIIQYSVNEAKWIAAKQYAKQKGYEFMILTENELGALTY